MNWIYLFYVTVLFSFNIAAVSIDDHLGHSKMDTMLCIHDLNQRDEDAPRPYNRSLTCSILKNWEKMKHKEKTCVSFWGLHRNKICRGRYPRHILLEIVAIILLHNNYAHSASAKQFFKHSDAFLFTYIWPTVDGGYNATACLRWMVSLGGISPATPAFTPPKMVSHRKSQKLGYCDHLP